MTFHSFLSRVDLLPIISDKDVFPYHIAKLSSIVPLGLPLLNFPSRFPVAIILCVPLSHVPKEYGFSFSDVSSQVSFSVSFFQDNFISLVCLFIVFSMFFYKTSLLQLHIISQLTNLLVVDDSLPYTMIGLSLYCIWFSATFLGTT